MKRLLIPFLALALCPPAQADKATFGLAELPPLPMLNDLSYTYSNPENPIIKQIEGQRRREAELKTQQREARCKAHRKQWKQFGNFKYDWYGWKQSNGTWVTTRQRVYLLSECSDTVGVSLLAIRPLSGRASTEVDKISVTCAGLKVSAKNSYAKEWEAWRLPEAGGETEMVAALCTEKN